MPTDLPDDYPAPLPPGLELLEVFQPSGAEEPDPAGAQEEEPVPFLRGRFSCYETPGGGVLLVWQQDGAEEPNRIHLPPLMVSAARQLAAGGELPGGPQMFNVLRKLVKRR